MAINSNVQRKMGVILQYVQMGIGILIQILYTPFYLKILGSNEYGIYNLASSTIAYLNLLSLGFGASYLKFYSCIKKKNDENELANLNGLYLIVFIIMGFIALCVGMIMSQNAQIFLNDTYSEKEIEITKILMFILSINLAISFPASVFVSYVSSQEKFIYQKTLNIGKTVLSPVVEIVFLLNGFGSIGMVVSTTVISLAIDFINIFYCFKKIGMTVSIKQIDISLLKDIFAFSIFIAINQIIDQINWQTDKIILAKVVNGTSVAIYAVGSTINSMFTRFSTSVSNVFAPRVNQLVANNEENMDEQLSLLFIKIGRLQWFILTLVLTGFIFFGQYFIELWVGNEYKNSYWICLLLMSPAMIPLIQNIGIEIQRAKNKHQFRSIVYLIMSFINVGVSIIFANIWGEIGAALGTTISLLLANGLIMNIYYHKKLGINITAFWKSIMKTIPGLIIPIIFGCLLMKYYHFSGVINYILFVTVYIVIYCVSIYVFSFNEDEKEIIESIKNKFRRNMNAK